MAKLTLLSPEDIKAREEKPRRPRLGRQCSLERTRAIEELKQALTGAAPGYGGDVTLSPSEDKRIARLNIAEAANELGLALIFRPRRDKNLLHFRILTPEEKAARPKRSGRPRKQVEEEQDIGV